MMNPIPSGLLRRFISRESPACAMLVFLALAVPAPAFGSVLKLPFAELAQTADLIFIGTVVSRESRLNAANTMVFTDVTFGNPESVHGGPRSLQKDAPSIALTFAGGEVGGTAVEVSDTPRLEIGHRYLVFMADDGGVYSTPVVGGYQGLFEVISDQAGGEILIDAGGKAILAVGDDGPVPSLRRLVEMRRGIPIYEEPPPTKEGERGGNLFVPSGPGLSVTPSVFTEAAAVPLPLRDFVSYVADKALRQPLPRRVLPVPGQRGKLLKMVDGKVESEDLPAPPPMSPRPLVPVFGPGNAAEAASAGPGKAGPIGWCGYQDLPLVMEQLPADWAEFGVNNDCMWSWNIYMGIYQFRYSDGLVGWQNDESEFCGYMDNATVSAYWGFSWGPGTIAMCKTMSYGGCKKITESDVLWNAGLSWTHDPAVSIGNGGVVLLRPVNVHELGHTWGAQRGTYDPNIYDFDVPTVMQAYYSSVVEDGWGVQPVDAYMIRRAYQNQTGIPGWRDVGVESYYASGGLHNSTTDDSAYYQGEPMTVQNFTVTNMSLNPVSNLRLRFYLSSDRWITTGDYRVPGTFQAASFNGEDYITQNFSMNVPTNMPPGRYYVGALVTINGLGADDYGWNNSTSLYDQVLIHPQAPDNLSASDGTFLNRVRIAWDTVPGDVTYQVWRADLNDPAYGSVIASGLTGSSYADYAAVPRKTYYYWVRAWSADYGISSFSSSDSGYRKLAAPGAVSASDGSYGDRVLVTWGYVNGADSYDVFRNTAALQGTAVKIAGGVTSLSWSDYNALPLKTYYYWVRARNSYGISGWSSLDPGFRNLLAPTNVAASFSTFDDKIRLAWNPVPGASSYEVWRNTTANSAGAVRIGFPPAAVYNDTTATPLRDYFYWIKARCSYGTSGFSSGAWGLRDLAAPATLSASDGTHQDRVRVTWSKVALGEGYRVYRREAGGGYFTEIGAVHSADATTFDDHVECGGSIMYEYQARAATGYGVGRPSPPDTGSSGACPPFQVLLPYGYEKLGSGTHFTITWQTLPNIASVTIMYSLTGGAPWTTLADHYSSLPGAAPGYDWLVPVATSDTCLVKIIAYDGLGTEVGWDTNDAFFSITNVDIDFPDGENTLVSGTVVNITWITYQTAAPVAKTFLRFSSYEGATWELIAKVNGNPGTLPWTVPEVSSDRCLVRIVLKDSQGNVLGSDQSDWFFTIEPPLP